MPEELALHQELAGTQCDGGDGDDGAGPSRGADGASASEGRVRAALLQS